MLVQYTGQIVRVTNVSAKGDAPGGNNITAIGLDSRCVRKATEQEYKVVTKTKSWEYNVGVAVMYQDFRDCGALFMAQ